MINFLTVTNYVGRSLKIDLRNPWLVGLNITSITGIGAGKASINSTELATRDGGVYNSARLSYRNIVINVQFLPIPTIEESRNRTYEYFPIKKPIILTFETDTKKVQIKGYVESNETTHFEEKTGTQISVICENPYFYDISEDFNSAITFSNIQPLFEFPFENNSLTEPLLEFSSSTSITEKNIDYRGDAEVGMFMTLQFTGTVKNITIHNITLDQHMKIDTKRLQSIVGTDYFKAGDEVTINTIMGEKFIYLQRNGETKSILTCLDKNVDWINLVSGDNHFAYVSESGIEYINFQIKYLLYYQGI